MKLTPTLGNRRSQNLQEVTKMAAVFSELECDGSVGFDAFAGWYNASQEKLRRAAVRRVKEAFNSLDADGSGRLNKSEFGKLAAKAKLHLDPPFSLEADWKQCKKVKQEGIEDAEEEVNYASFEAWCDDPPAPPRRRPEEPWVVVNCPTRQSLLLFIGSLHRFRYPDNKEI